MNVKVEIEANIYDVTDAAGDDYEFDASVDGDGDIRIELPGRYKEELSEAKDEITRLNDRIAGLEENNRTLLNDLAACQDDGA